MQAITTKFIGPTNFRGARIKASCERGTITIGYDHAGNDEEGHIAAADALVAKFVKEDGERYGTDRNPWQRARVCGQAKSGEYQHVFLPSMAVVIEATHIDDHEHMAKIARKAVQLAKNEFQAGPQDRSIFFAALSRSKISA